MSKNKKSEFVAVKVEGPFTEWYSPNYKDPYEDNDEYRGYYDEHILEYQPVVGPSLGDADDEYISGDLQFLAERLTSVCCDPGDDWDHEIKNVKCLIKMALECGVTYKYILPDGEEIIITPYRKCEMPPINEDHLKVYGEMAELIKERVAAI